MTVCRVCLSGGDVKLLSVIHVKLREVYEKLTDSKFNSKDGRPTVICPFCYQRLLRCCTLSAMAHRAEKVLDKLILKGLEATHETIEDLNLGMVQLSEGPRQCFKLGSKTPKRNSLLTVKQEPIAAQIITVKEELDNNPVMSLICDERLNNQFDFEDSNTNVELPAQRTPETATVKSCKVLILQTTVVKPAPKHGCNKCEQDFNNLISLREHLKLHSKKSYTCNVCNKDFITSHQLLTHVIQHSQVKKYSCVVCNRQCRTDAHLKKHMHNVHKVVKIQHSCDVCEIQCTNAWNLKRHMEIHKWCL